MTTVDNRGLLLFMCAICCFAAYHAEVDSAARLTRYAFRQPAGAETLLRQLRSRMLWSPSNITPRIS